MKLVVKQADQRQKKDIVEIEVRGIDNKRSLDGPTDPLNSRSRPQNQLHIQSDYQTNPASGFQSQKLTQKQSMQEFEKALGIKDQAERSGPSRAGVAPQRRQDFDHRQLPDVMTSNPEFMSKLNDLDIKSRSNIDGIIAGDMHEDSIMASTQNAAQAKRGGSVLQSQEKELGESINAIRPTQTTQGPDSSQQTLQGSTNQGTQSRILEFQSRQRSVETIGKGQSTELMESLFISGKQSPMKAGKGPNKNQKAAYPADEPINHQSQMSIFSDQRGQANQQDERLVILNTMQRKIDEKSRNLILRTDNQTMSIPKRQNQKVAFQPGTLSQTKSRSTLRDANKQGSLSLKGFQSLPKIDSNQQSSVLEAPYAHSIDHQRSVNDSNYHTLYQAANKQYASTNIPMKACSTAKQDDKRGDRAFKKSPVATKRFQNYCDKSLENLKKTKMEHGQGQERKLFVGQVSERLNRIDAQKLHLRELLTVPINKGKPAPSTSPDTLEGTLQSKQIKKPILEMDKKDLNQLLKGKDASKQFIERNRKPLAAYLNAVMKSEDQMMGYLEFTSANQLHGGKTQKPIDQAISMNDQLQEQAQGEQEEGSPGAEYADSQGQPPIPAKEEETDNWSKVGQVAVEDFRHLMTRDNMKFAKLVKNSGPRNTDLKSLGVTSKVMENWLNETLADAEHLDIPGVILRPEHKNPITRYGIDRMELTNSGLPNDFVDRVYRCLFVYSVGFYEMIYKVIEHSNHKYALITRIWKVFAVLLEYCCINDYQMMIQKINQQHEEHVEQLHRGFEAKCAEFLDNENLLKQNIAVLQRSNEELEHDRTNERTLRLRLEEEYMQNTKNHEEEVQLRLKFESKLNQMHTQQRETDIKLNRHIYELQQAKTQNANMLAELKSNGEKMLEDQHLIQKQSDRLAALEERNGVLEQDVENKTDQLVKLDARVKVNQEETNKTRFQMGQIQNENNKHTLTIDMLETQHNAEKHQKETLERLLKEATDLKTNFEERSKDLKNKCDEQQVNLNEVSKKGQINNDELRAKAQLVEVQRIQIEQQNSTLEDLMITKQNQIAEINALQQQVNNLKGQCEDASEKLHLTNRYRHELEINYKAEKLTQERLKNTLLQRDETINVQKDSIRALNDTVNKKGLMISQQGLEIHDLKETLEKKVQAFNHEIDELRDVLGGERRQKEDWVDKFKASAEQLGKHKERALACEQHLQLKDLELAKLSADLERMLGTLNHEREERQQFESEAKENLRQMKLKEAELTEMVEVSRQLEQQRYNQYKKADSDISELQNEIETMSMHHEMEIEDHMSQILRMHTNDQAEINTLQTDLANQQQENERIQMLYEDAYRHNFNAVNQQQLLASQLDDLASQLKYQQSKAYIEYEQMQQSLQQQVDNLRQKLEQRSDESKSLAQQLSQAKEEERSPPTPSDGKMMEQAKIDQVDEPTKKVPEVQQKTFKNQEVQVNLLTDYQTNDKQNYNNQSIKSGSQPLHVSNPIQPNEKHLSAMRKGIAQQETKSDQNLKKLIQYTDQSSNQYHQTAMPNDANNSGQNVTTNILLNQKGLAQIQKNQSLIQQYNDQVVPSVHSNQVASQGNRGEDLGQSPDDRSGSNWRQSLSSKRSKNFDGQPTQQERQTSFVNQNLIKEGDSPKMEGKYTDDYVPENSHGSSNQKQRSAGSNLMRTSDNQMRQYAQDSKQQSLVSNQRSKQSLITNLRLSQHNDSNNTDQPHSGESKKSKQHREGVTRSTHLLVQGHQENEERPQLDENQVQPTHLLKGTAQEVQQMKHLEQNQSAINAIKVSKAPKMGEQASSKQSKMSSQASDQGSQANTSTAKLTQQMAQLSGKSSIREPPLPNEAPQAVDSGMQRQIVRQGPASQLAPQDQNQDINHTLRNEQQQSEPYGQQPRNQIGGQLEYSGASSAIPRAQPRASASMVQPESEDASTKEKKNIQQLAQELGEIVAESTSQGALRDAADSNPAALQLAAAEDQHSGGQEAEQKLGRPEHDVGTANRVEPGAASSSRDQTSNPMPPTMMPNLYQDSKYETAGTVPLITATVQPQIQVNRQEPRAEVISQNKQPKQTKQKDEETSKQKRRGNDQIKALLRGAQSRPAKY